jgi:hypothetical protein
VLTVDLDDRTGAGAAVAMSHVDAEFEESLHHLLDRLGPGIGTAE